MDPTTKLELDVDVKGGKISESIFNLDPSPQNTNQIIKGGLTSESFSLWFKSPQKRCQITILQITFL